MEMGKHVFIMVGCIPHAIVASGIHYVVCISYHMTIWYAFSTMWYVLFTRALSPLYVCLSFHTFSQCITSSMHRWRKVIALPLGVAYKLIKGGGTLTNCFSVKVGNMPRRRKVICYLMMPLVVA